MYSNFKFCYFKDIFLYRYGMLNAKYAIIIQHNALTVCVQVNFSNY